MRAALLAVLAVFGICAVLGSLAGFSEAERVEVKDMPELERWVLHRLTDMDALVRGAVDPARVWQGEVWRLLAANFVHIGVWHFGLNMWVLWQVGRAYERLAGGSRTMLVYLSSGIFGFPKELCAEILLEETLAFFARSPDSSVRLVRMTNFDTPTVTDFLEALEALKTE